MNDGIAVISSESDPKRAAMYGDEQTGFAEAGRVSHTVSPTPSPWLSQPLTPSARASCIQGGFSTMPLSKKADTSCVSKLNLEFGCWAPTLTLAAVAPSDLGRVIHTL